MMFFPADCSCWSDNSDDCHGFLFETDAQLDHAIQAFDIFQVMGKGACGFSPADDDQPFTIAENE